MTGVFVFVLFDHTAKKQAASVMMIDLLETLPTVSAGMGTGFVLKRATVLKWLLFSLSPHFNRVLI